jgi:large subunit ribosomal protein L28
MSRLCPVSNKKGLVGNYVSHANNKTKRRYQPNLQNVTLMSDILGRSLHVRLSTRGLKTVEFHGGLDGYVSTTAASRLAPEFKAIKKQIQASLKASL